MNFGFGVDHMIGVQTRLSTTQAVPIVGPLVFSPVKAVISVAQAIVGLAGAIIFALGYCLSGNDFLHKRLQQCCQHAGMGTTGLTYSAINIVTLGIFGFIAERYLIPYLQKQYLISVFSELDNIIYHR